MRSALMLLLALSGSAAAGTDRAPQLPDVGFAGLRAHTAPSPCFGPVSVHFDPALASPRDDFIELPDHPAGGWRVLLAGRIDRNAQDRYEIRYDDGPSCDPTFTIWREGDEAPLGEFGGDHLVLPGNGFLYVIRRSNRSKPLRSLTGLLLKPKVKGNRIAFNLNFQKHKKTSLRYRLGVI